ncbi:MAG TPA: PIG-L family deacetylase [Verrucomicrobiae bacterium]|jgi:LmbE family N-acetylglucosaminyl deacetylase
MNHRQTFAALFVGLVLVFGLRADNAEQSPKQGAALLKTDIMGVFAHPDDETGASATLAAYALGKGKVVANVYCTRGEGGGNSVGKQWGDSLGILREAELRDSLALIGVRYCYFLDRQDFFYTESVAATLTKWNKEVTLERLVRLVRALRPEVIITMNPAPTPGQHGHHQAAGVLATEAFSAAADPSRFPEQITKEGLSVWQPRKLYYGGGGHGADAIISVAEVLPNGKTPAETAGEAAANHRSQAFGNFSRSGRPPRPQTFTLVKSVVPFIDSEDDLFRGLPVSGETPRLATSPRDNHQQTPVEIEFTLRPAVAAYLQWAKAQGIEHVVEKLAADLPVVAGEENDIEFEVRNKRSTAAEGTIQLQAPAGWRVTPTSVGYNIGSLSARTLHCRVVPPKSLEPDADLVAASQLGDSDVSGSVRLHIVPRMNVTAVESAPSLDGSGAGWENIPDVYISPSNLVSGKVQDAADSSARFRLAHDSQTLFISVDVADDVVVSNIAPDDIRGHWRSDSVEICIDPNPGSENTLGCFKVGIFPFDSTGVVRAARDADANQGPIEETAPAMRVFSRRTPGGYLIQAAIPFAEIGVQPKQTKRLGFNILIYDGDKADAVLGENINKSRIAWAPRSGVQGRPEDWGRIDLQ